MRYYDYAQSHLITDRITWPIASQIARQITSRITWSIAMRIIDDSWWIK